MAKSSVKKTNNSWLKRVAASLVMLPVAVGALWFGYPFVDVLALFVGTLLCFEWASMVQGRNFCTYMGAYLFALAVCLFVFDVVIDLSVLVAVSAFVWFKAKGEEHRYLITLGVPYISVGIASLLWLYHDVFSYPPYNFYMTLWFFVMVWAMDIGGLFVGTTVKGPKLAPKISPNKTWSGLFGGLLLAAAASYAYFWAFSLMGIMQTDFSVQCFFAILGVIIAFISQIGDLVESAIKRRLGLKDSSHIIPGHGGVFDRIDGLIFAGPFVYWLFKYGIWYL